MYVEPVLSKQNVLYMYFKRWGTLIIHLHPMDLSHPKLIWNMSVFDIWDVFQSESGRF